MMAKKEKTCPLDEIFMNKRETYFFEKGRDNMLGELKRNKEIENFRILKINKLRELSGEVSELKGSLRAVENAVKYWKGRATRFENKGVVIRNQINESKLTKKEKEKIIKIFDSGDEKYSKEHKTQLLGEKK